MSTPVPAVLGIFTVASMTILVTGCKPMEDVLAVMNNGEPMPGGPSSSAMSLSQTVETVEPVAVVAEVPAVNPADCVVPAHLFRSMQCDEITGQLIPIR